MIRRLVIHLEFILHVIVIRETGCIMGSLITSFIHYLSKYSFCATKSPSHLYGQIMYWWPNKCHLYCSTCFGYDKEMYLSELSYKT